MQHHANLYIGPEEWALLHLPEAYAKEDQDVRFIHFDKMTIGDARNLVNEASLRPVIRDTRVFVVFAQTILLEAQNALLKLLEEPNLQTVFYVILPRNDILIPTLLSRFHVVAEYTEDSNKNAFNEFYRESYAGRLKLIETKLKQEDYIWVSQIVEGLEIHAHDSKRKELIEDTLMLVQYINTNGSSKKMLLEHIALSL